MLRSMRIRFFYFNKHLSCFKLSFSSLNRIRTRARCFLFQAFWVYADGHASMSRHVLLLSFHFFFLSLSHLKRLKNMKNIKKRLQTFSLQSFSGGPAGPRGFVRDLYLAFREELLKFLSVAAVRGASQELRHWEMAVTRAALARGHR